jgi:chromodomain-helicase-DNA-binding protein 1
MSSPVRDGSSNGQQSPRSPSASPKIASRRSSISEHSDDNGARPIAASPSPSPDPDDETIYINGGHDFAESSNSPDQNNASDDGDFDMDDDALNAQSDGGDVAADARSSSGDSQQSLKRKASQDEDRYIKANPELYGLRRSVRNQATTLHALC